MSLDVDQDCEKRILGTNNKIRAFSATASRNNDALVQNNRGWIEELFLCFLANLSSNNIHRKSFGIIQLINEIQAHSFVRMKTGHPVGQEMEN